MKMLDFDLSIGAIVAMTGIAVAQALLAGFSLPVSVGFGLLTGIVCGMVNGYLVAYVELNALICTPGYDDVIAGGALAITKGVSLWNLPEEFDLSAVTTFWAFPSVFSGYDCVARGPCPLP